MAAELSLGAIIRSKGNEYLSRHPETSPLRIKVMRAIADCHTEALGGHRDRCDRCGYEHVFWNSCRNRHCPACGGQARETWLEGRRQELLDIPYFHGVFTIPETLNPLALYAPEIVYTILLRSAAQAIVDVGQTKLRAQMGVLSVLHTWGQVLNFHPHVHCIIPGGGFSLDGRRWVGVRKGSFLFAVKVLSRHFRTLVTNAIRHAYLTGQLNLPDSIAADGTALDLILAQSCKTDWHVYLKPPFGGPEHVLGYLAAYTHRIAIANSRLLAFDGEHVSFSWRDYSDGNARKSITLDTDEFIRRFLMHVVPRGFVRIRYYGFLANRVRAASIEKARELIGSRRQPRPRPLPVPLCSQCHKGKMLPLALVPPARPRTWFDTS